MFQTLVHSIFSLATLFDKLLYPDDVIRARVPTIGPEEHHIPIEANGELIVLLSVLST